MGSNLGRPVGNKHKVPVKQWNKWSNEARRTFNQLMYLLRPQMQWVYLHPEASPAQREHWNTTRWNVAWTGAELTDGFYPKVKPNTNDARIRRLSVECTCALMSNGDHYAYCAKNKVTRGK